MNHSGPARQWALRCACAIRHARFRTRNPQYYHATLDAIPATPAANLSIRRWLSPSIATRSGPLARPRRLAYRSHSPGAMRIPMRTLAAAGLAIALVAPALEADSGQGVLRIGAEVTAHCAVTTPANVSAPASIRCSKNAGGTIAASMDGRAPSCRAARCRSLRGGRRRFALPARPSSGAVRVLTVQF